eukprot:INCI797.1.p1 GENE.INCI797.1~~INCI797.1.p1  ORF type:complete len:451 (+),score=59.77 INCI797.1:283-1635(+)
MGSAQGVHAYGRPHGMPRRRAQAQQSWTPISEVLRGRHARLNSHQRHVMAGLQSGRRRQQPRLETALNPNHCANCYNSLAGSSKHQCDQCINYALCSSCYPRRGTFHNGTHSFSAIHSHSPAATSSDIAAILQQVASGFGRALVHAAPVVSAARGRSSTPNRPRYHCHYCNISFLLDADQAQPQASAGGSDTPAVHCPRCHTGFVELQATVAAESFDRVDIMLQELQRAFDIVGSLQQQGLRPGAGGPTLLMVPSQNAGPRPAPDAALKKLEEFSLRLSHIRSCPSCVICMEDWTEGEKAVRLPCNHVFHKECVVHWLKSRNSCPVCREKLRSIASNASSSGGGRENASIAHAERPRQRLRLVEAFRDIFGESSSSSVRSASAVSTTPVRQIPENTSARSGPTLREILPNAADVSDDEEPVAERSDLEVDGGTPDQSEHEQRVASPGVDV